MNNELLENLALKTGGSHFPAVFGHYQKDYVLHVLSEMYEIFLQGNRTYDYDNYLAIDFWNDIVKHFALDSYEIDKLLKNNENNS